VECGKGVGKCGGAIKMASKMRLHFTRHFSYIIYTMYAMRFRLFVWRVALGD
jgi:hypothetical protein